MLEIVCRVELQRVPANLPKVRPDGFHPQDAGVSGFDIALPPSREHITIVPASISAEASQSLDGDQAAPASLLHCHPGNLPQPPPADAAFLAGVAEEPAEQVSAVVLGRTEHHDLSAVRRVPGTGNPKPWSDLIEQLITAGERPGKSSANAGKHSSILWPASGVPVRLLAGVWQPLWLRRTGRAGTVKVSLLVVCGHGGNGRSDRCLTCRHLSDP